MSPRLRCFSNISTSAPCWTQRVCVSRASEGVPDQVDLRESRVVLDPEDWWYDQLLLGMLAVSRGSLTASLFSLSRVTAVSVETG